MAITVYTYNDKVLKNVTTDKWLKKHEAPVNPYNPLGLDPGVFRIQVTSGTSSWTGAQTATLVPGTSDVYDVLFTEANKTQYSKTIVLKVLGANAYGMTNLSGMFQSCSNLEEVAVLDISGVTDISGMFSMCSNLYSIAANMPTGNAQNWTSTFASDTSLTQLPLFDTSSAVNVSAMFGGCTNVESGALALYQQMSTQANPPTTTANCFGSCGVNTETGMAEFIQIPQSWGGGAS